MSQTPNKSCTCGGCGSLACDCCTGPRVLTPELIYNASGLATLRRRAGTWDTFRQSMIARLSAGADFPALAGLRTREPEDPSIAFLDAGAVVGDVLTFYSERLANEGYLRTAIARRSLTELGRLVGYRPRPGVAASAWLAFTLDAGYNITIPAGTRVQSVPASPKEKAQTFETSSDLTARAELNQLKPRPSIPQEISPATVLNVETIWLKGIGLSLKPGDMLLFVFPEDELASLPRKIHAVTENATAERTTVTLVVEKLSAAFYLPVLRKAVETMRQSIPDAWLTDDREWAKNAAAALDAVAARLGSNASLLDIGTIFLPGDPAGLKPALKAASEQGAVAVTLDAEVRKRGAWKETLTAAWHDTLTKAATQEALLLEVFARLAVIDTNPNLPMKIAMATAIVELLRDGTQAVPRPLNACVPSVRAAAMGLAAAAGTAMLALTDAVFSAALALGRPAFDTLGSAGPAKTARVKAMTLLADQQDVLDSDLATVSRILLDGNGNGTLSKAIADATTSGAPAVATMLGEIQAILAKQWDDLETSMRVAPTSPAATDSFLKNLIKESAAIVTELVKTPVTDPRNDRIAALTLAAQAHLDLYGSDTDPNAANVVLRQIIATGEAGVALANHGIDFAKKSVAGLRNAIRLLVGRYRSAVTGPVADEVIKLGDAVASSPETASLQDIHGKLAAALEKISELVKGSQDVVQLRLKAEMVILNGQVSVSPSGAISPAAFTANPAAAALGSIVSGTVLQRPQAPGSPLSVSRSLGSFLPSPDGTGGTASDAVSRLAGRLSGSSDDDLFSAWRRLNTGTPAVEIHAMRVQASVFGSAAPMRFGAGADNSFDKRFDKPGGDGDWTEDGDDLKRTIRLDGEHSKVVRDGWIVIERPETTDAGVTTRTVVDHVSDVTVAPHSAYSLSGKATTVNLLKNDRWGDDKLKFGVIRGTKVYAASELLPLAEMPVDRDIGPAAAGTGDNPFAEAPDVLVLDGLYQGFAPGHRLLVSGERADSVSARPVREYALVSKVEHVLNPAVADPLKPLPGDTPHTRLTLSKDLQYGYRRDTVTIFGNVVDATHGETKREVLGSGNARAAGQSFPLRSVPVTHVPAATANGAASTVQLRVDRILWREVDQFTDAGPDDRIFLLEIADDGSTSALFGDGKQGARLPTGSENVTAEYRSGIGRGGNVGAESLSTLLDRPLGLKGVINLLPASGGADRDGPEDIRKNAPLPLVALDRLVSVSDYAAFSRAFAGIGKAESALIGAGGGAFVHVTIAGQEDAPIDETSALMTSLTEALILLGDPLLPVRVQSRELLVLLLAANVRIDADREWAAVEPAIRTAVLAAFGFARRAPGQDVFLSEVVAAIQSVPGVDYVDVESFAGIPQKRATTVPATATAAATTARLALTPAELEEFVDAAIGGRRIDWQEKMGTPERRVPVEVDGEGNLINPPARLPTELAGFDEFGDLRPAQIALFLPDMPETLILNEIKS
jgi:hypothetical protein